MLVHGATGVVNIVRSTVNSNQAKTKNFSRGGGLNVVGTVTIFGSSVSSNNSYYDGGGIYFGTGNLTVQQSKIQSNIAGNMGAGFVVNGPMLVQDSSVTSNTATVAGGGFVFYGSFNLSGPLHQIQNSTISHNTAKGIVSILDGKGGGIFLTDAGNTLPTLKMYNCTLAHNQLTTGVAGNGTSVLGSGIYNAYADNVTQNLKIYSTIVATNFAAPVGTESIFGNLFADHSLFVQSASTMLLVGSVSNQIVTTAVENGLTIGGLSHNLTAAEQTTLKSIASGGPLPLGSPNGWTLSQRPKKTTGALTNSQLYIYGRGANPLGLPYDQRNFFSGTSYNRLAGVMVSGTGPFEDIGALEEEGSFNHRSLGSIEVIAADTSAVLTGGATAQTIQFTVFSDLPINAALLDANDLLVTAPDGSQLPVAAKGVMPGAVSDEYILTYQFTPPGGSWDYSDSGQYDIELQPDQVFDVTGMAAPETFLGSLQVIISATLTVTNTNDSGPGSLREAIEACNNNAGILDTIVFDPTVFATPQTIHLTGVPLEIDDPLTITGPGAAKLNVIADDPVRVFLISGGGDMPVSLSGMTLTGTVDQDIGGVIRSLGSALSVNNCVLTQPIGATKLPTNGGAD